MNDKTLLQVAKIGKSVGLRGELKLHISSDFKDQFCTDATFLIDGGKEIVIDYFREDNSLIKFKNYNSREDAKTLTNKNLFTTIKESREHCSLNQDQYFWFDIIGSKVFDRDIYLGDILEIERIADIDYLIIRSDDSHVNKGLSKRFMIPYIKKYIDSFDLDNKRLSTVDTYLILESS